MLESSRFCLNDFGVWFVILGVVTLDGNRSMV